MSIKGTRDSGHERVPHRDEREMSTHHGVYIKKGELEGILAGLKKAFADGNYSLIKLFMKKRNLYYWKCDEIKKIHNSYGGVINIRKDTGNGKNNWIRFEEDGR